MKQRHKFTDKKIYIRTIIILVSFCIIGTLLTFVFNPYPTNTQTPVIAWRYIVFWLITLDVPALVVFFVSRKRMTFSDMKKVLNQVMVIFAIISMIFFVVENTSLDFLIAFIGLHILLPEAFLETEDLPNQ